MDELGKIVRPQSPTRSCNISPDDKSHIGLILSETKVSDKSGEKILGLRTNEIVCALSSKTIYLSNTGQVISNIDLPYYWCNFCTFKFEDKHLLIKHLMEHRFSCQFCKFQTFSRIDVVRHTVQEHQEFEGGDLKFCVLLPDLLKHGLKQEMAEDNMVFSSKSSSKESPERTSISKKDPESESESLKRKRMGSSSEDDSKKKKIQPRNRAIRGKKRGRPPGSYVRRKPTQSSSDSENEQPATRRSTRSTPVEDNKSSTTPGVCFECSVCKFRTFKRPVLANHASLKHGKVKPAFSLKIVSKSQAKEIEENDEKSISIKKSRPERTVSKNDSGNDDGRNTHSKSDVSKDEKNKMGSKNSPSKDAGSKKASSKSDEDDKVEEESVDTPVVEMDYAEEDEDDDYVASDYDDDEDEDFIPSTEKKKGHYIKRQSLSQKLNKLKAGAKPQEQGKNDIKRPEASPQEQGINDIRKSEAGLQEQGRNDITKPEAKPEERGTFKCLLCSKVSKESFQTVRDHYFVDHPGGSLIMSEISGKEEQWIYFCITQNCLYQNVNPTAWLEHCKICQKNIFQNPDGSNSKHDSVINTANTVRENMTLTPQAYPSEGVRTEVQVVKIKEEPVEDIPVQTKYIYSNEPVPICMIPNRADVQQSTVSNAGGSGVTVATPPSIPLTPMVTSHPPVPLAPFPIIPPVTLAPLPNTPPVSGRSSAGLINKIMIEKMNQKQSMSPPSTTPVANTNNLTTGAPKMAAALLRNSGTTAATTLPSNIGTAATTLPSNVDTVAKALPINSGTAVKTLPSNSGTAASKPSQLSTAVVKPNSIGSAPARKASPKSKKTTEENVPFNVDLKGNYKCAHCRFLGSKAMEIRNHMVERHRMNPLYGLDMLAEEKQVPRFMMFCPKEGCDFCTKGKDLFLSHLAECALVEDPKKKFTDEYKKRVEVTRNFAAKTLQKLQSLTQQC